MNPETKLCLAAALNGTCFTREEFNADLVPLVTVTLEDWFRFNPAEASQSFARDKDGVLADLETARQPELVSVLQEMGFAMTEGLVSLNGHQWSQFIDEQWRLASILPSQGELEVEFPLESVKELLQDALDDDDQISLLWAAFLFGFDRSRVAGAWRTEDTVELRFASTEDREAALDAFRSLTGQA